MIMSPRLSQVIPTSKPGIRTQNAASHKLFLRNDMMIPLRMEIEAGRSLRSYERSTRTILSLLRSWLRRYSSPVRERRFLEAPGDFIPDSTSPIDDSVTETDEVSDAEASGSVCLGTPHTGGQSRRHCNDLEETPTSSQSANCGKDASSAGPERPRNIDGTHRNKRQKRSRKGKERADDSEDEDEDDGAPPETSKNRKKPADDLPWSCPYSWNVSGSGKDTMSSTCYPKYKKRTRCAWKNHLESIHTNRGKGGSPEYIMKPEQWSEVITAIAQALPKRPRPPKMRHDWAEKSGKKRRLSFFPTLTRQTILLSEPRSSLIR
ncbi:hypothetical protein HYQ46_012328 [Verticillium longisporum]|nr:hypothetical protein HYQ44_012864 [Verticillium longisporum]KAG7151869.1 hypothetical protein HYQ46_012328 [Verticillium longisporum]